jgi:hypothetical protein
MLARLDQDARVAPVLPHAWSKSTRAKSIEAAVGQGSAVFSRGVLLDGYP